MDEDGLPIVGTGIDYTKVKPLDQKRLLAFINHYVAHTVRFLNRFSGVCEEKIAVIESQMQRLETTMSILEGKLSSIPGLDGVTVSDAPPTQSTAAPVDAAPAPPAAAPGGEPNTTVQASTEQTAIEQPLPAAEPEVVEENFVKISQDDRYKRFFKMLNMGVPPQAVKIKMAAEGFDADLLDTPDAPAPPAGATKDSSSDSEEAFTDSD